MFQYNKKNKKINWQNDEIKVEFSEPSIQAHDEYKLIESTEDILYYYYTIKIFNKRQTKKDKYKWHLVYSKFIYDFPAILEFRKMLNFFITLNPVEQGQKVEYQDKTIKYQYSLNTSGFFNANEDYYELKKETDEKGENPIYTLYIGGAIGDEIDITTTVIRIPRITQEEIQELLKCIDSFIDFSIKKENKKTEKLVKKKTELEIKKVEEYKLYEYKSDGVSIKGLYCIGDSIEITYYVDKEFGETKTYSDQIKKVTETTLTLNNDVDIPIKNIIHVFKNVSDEEIRYNQMEIANEFISHLADAEKEEFQTLPTKKLLKKYKSAIIDRTWMCRNEHNFEYKRTGKPTKDITPIVKEVIHIIKHNLNHS